MIELNKYFAQKRVNKILDIGTGSGNFILVLKEVFPDAEMIGVDPNLNSLKDASQRFSDVQFNEMSAENLDFEDKSFDVVSMSMALHHIPDVEKSLLEMQRVLKPGGWIIINELFSDNLSEAQKVHKMYHHFKSRIDQILGTSHNQTFKKEEILNIIRNSGIIVLFHFEFHKSENLIQSEKDIEERVEKMSIMLNEIKDRPEYEELKPQIAEFREKAKTLDRKSVV